MKYKISLHTALHIALVLVFGISGMAFVSCRQYSTDDNQHAQNDSDIKAVPGLKLLAELPAKVKETSGLALIGDFLVTHNDKGKANELVLIDAENGSITQTITVSNIQNNDWEDVARNNEYLFIGDMGNNDGDRKNLAIYLIPINNINKNTTSIKSSGSINFYYDEQKEFDANKKHNFDCEALLCYNNQLYIFTKNRLDNRTDLYALPIKPGNYPAKYIAGFEAGVRITGADISADGKKVAIIGYNKKSVCILWTFENFKGDNFFAGKSKKYNLGSYSNVGQMEGIAFKDNSSIYISSEEIAHVPARLYLFKL